MNDCDSCSGCPASAEPGTCEEAGPSSRKVAFGGIEYEIRQEVANCRGCHAEEQDGACDHLSLTHKCFQNKVIFVRKTQRLSPADFDQLKVRAIEEHAGEWLHHWGRMVEEEVLRRNLVEVQS